MEKSISDLVIELEEKEKEIKKSGVNDDLAVLTQIGNYINGELKKNLAWNQLNYLAAFYIYIVNNYKQKWAIRYADKVKGQCADSFKNRYTTKGEVTAYFDKIISDNALYDFLISLNDEQIIKTLLDVAEEKQNDHEFNRVQKRYLDLIPKEKQMDSSVFLSKSAKKLVDHLNENVKDAIGSNSTFVDSSSPNKAKNWEFKEGQKIAKAPKSLFDYIKEQLSNKQGNDITISDLKGTNVSGISGSLVTEMNNPTNDGPNMKQ